MRNPRDFVKPLADRRARPAARDPGHALADDPLLRPLEREDGRQGCPTSRPRPTSCSATSRTRCRPTARRPRARGWSGSAARSTSASTALWTRVNSLDSPWVLDDLLRLVGEIGDRLDVIMVPKVEGAWDIHYVDRLLAQLEARHCDRAADPRPRDPRDRARRHERRGDRGRLAAHAGDELRPGRPRRVAAHEDDARRRRPPGLRRARRPGGRRPRGAARERPAGPLALLDRAHGRRLRGDRHPAVLRPVRRHRATSPAARRSSAPRS